MASSLLQYFVRVGRMPEQPSRENNILLGFAADIIAAYVSHNALSASDLPKLVTEVHTALTRLNSPPVAPVEMEPPKPAVSARKSITPDYLICLDDGKRFKSLKRHLSQLGMTPDQYREKWNLPSDYPMVAPNYSTTRSAMAKSFGLGRKPAATPPASPKSSSGRKAQTTT